MGAPRRIDPKSLGPVFSLCRCAGVDAALMFLQVHPPEKTKSEMVQRIQNTKVASAKVAFETVRSVPMAKIQKCLSNDLVHCALYLNNTYHGKKRSVT